MGPVNRPKCIPCCWEHLPPPSVCSSSLRGVNKRQMDGWWMKVVVAADTGPRFSCVRRSTQLWSPAVTALPSFGIHLQPPHIFWERMLKALRRFQIESFCLNLTFLSVAPLSPIVLPWQARDKARITDEVGMGFSGKSLWNVANWKWKEKKKQKTNNLVF